MKKRGFAFQQNPSEIYEQTDASPISIYIHMLMCIYVYTLIIQEGP